VHFYRYSSSPKEYERTIQQIVTQWAKHSGADVSKGVIQVSTREPVTPDKWRAGVLKENREKAWTLTARAGR
jgi:hypothetical protein